MTDIAASAASAAVPATTLLTLDGWRNADPVLGMALLIIVGLVAGEWVQRLTRLPRVAGPMLAGMLASPVGLNLLQRTELDPWKPLLDLAVGVLVFELGSRIQPRWLLSNPWLGIKSLAEAALTFLIVTWTLMSLGASGLSAVLAGAVAMASSPVITACVVHELQPRGQVTERLMMMTAFNSVLAVLAIKAWAIVAAVGGGAPGHEASAVLSQSLLVIGGSFLLGMAAGLLIEGLTRVLQGSQSQTVLQMAVVILAAMLAAQWKLSALLTLLVAGVWARWRMGHRLRVEPQLGTAGEALTMLLLVSLGVTATLSGSLAVWLWVLALIAARAVAKIVAVTALAKASALGVKQAVGLGVALQPMSTLAVLLTADTFGWPSALPRPEADILQAILIATTLMELSGPAWTQMGLGRIAGEVPVADRKP